MNRDFRVVVQNQIWQEYGYQEYINSYRGKCKVIEVKVIPFTTELQPEIDFIPDLVLGSGKLVNIARDRGWPTYPSFDPIELELFDSSLWLNGGGEAITIGQLSNLSTEEIFVKPFSEKLFTAGVINPSIPIIEQVQTTKCYNELIDERVWVSPVQTLPFEIRHFVVGGVVVSSSYYKIYGESIYRLADKRNVSVEYLQYLLTHLKYNNLVAVIDTTIIGDEFKIIEMNNLNSSGIYEADCDAVSTALINYIK
jgi:hypothetical protein